MTKFKYNSHIKNAHSRSLERSYRGAPYVKR